MHGAVWLFNAISILKPWKCSPRISHIFHITQIKIMFPFPCFRSLEAEPLTSMGEWDAVFTPHATKHVEMVSEGSRPVWGTWAGWNKIEQCWLRVGSQSDKKSEILYGSELGSSMWLGTRSAVGLYNKQGQNRMPYPKILDLRIEKK